MKTSLVLSLLLLGVAGRTPIALAQAAGSGSFTPTGSMATPRFGHTATLLPDGRILIAGGYTNGVPPFGHAPNATAELYDPATGQFTATGNMTSARAYHTATLLPDGRVLIAAGSGGEAPSGPQAVGPEYSLVTAELYDPSTGTFTATGNMTTSSVVETNTATLLPDGRVLITGAPFTADLYDPGMGAFAATGNMTAPPPWATATLLPDGRVLLAAGFFPPELFDPGTGTFSLTGTGLGETGRATLLMKGTVLVVGGNDDPGPLTYAELYDPSTGIFTATGDMIAPRANHTVTLLPDGKALITGGSSWTGWGTGGPMYYFCCLSSAELYDPSARTFASTGSMATGRVGHTSTLFDNGEVLIVGGSAGPVLASAELYHPKASIPPPALLSLSGDGQGQGAIQHAGTYRIASADDPALAGEYLSIYLTGLADGSVIPPQVAIGGRLAPITFFGNVPGYPGLSVVNVRMPGGVAPGPAVPVRLTYMGRFSNQVTIGAQ